MRALAAGSLTAVVQEVPAAAFSEEALRQRLAEQDELERCARTHHDVISAAARHADTVPLPLATLYLGEHRVREALRTDAPRFHAALERVAGRVEWGVKVYATAPPVPAAGPGPAAPAAERGDGADASGRDYLSRVRSRNRAREDRMDTGLRAAERVDAEFRGIAVAARRLRTHGPELTGERRPQLLNAAYLVAAGADRAVTEAVGRLGAAEPGVAVEVTGPWVPYSFADGGGDDGGR